MKANNLDIWISLVPPSFTGQDVNNVQLDRYEMIYSIINRIGQVSSVAKLIIGFSGMIFKHRTLRTGYSMGLQ